MQGLRIYGTPIVLKLSNDDLDARARAVAVFLVQRGRGTVLDLSLINPLSHVVKYQRGFGAGTSLAHEGIGVEPAGGGPMMIYMHSTLGFVARRYDVSPGNLGSILHGKLLSQLSVSYTNEIKGHAFFAVDKDGSVLGGREKWTSLIPFGEDEAKKNRAQEYHDELQVRHERDFDKIGFRLNPDPDGLGMIILDTTSHTAAAIAICPPETTRIKRNDLATGMDLSLRGFYLCLRAVSYTNHFGIPGTNSGVSIYGLDQDGNVVGGNRYDGRAPWGEAERVFNRAATYATTRRGDTFDSCRRNMDGTDPVYRSDKNCSAAALEWKVCRVEFGKVMSGKATRRQEGKYTIYTNVLGEYRYSKCISPRVEEDRDWTGTVPWYGV